MWTDNKLNVWISMVVYFCFFSSRRRHTRYWRDWSSDVCSSDLGSVPRAQDPECTCIFGQRQRQRGGGAGVALRPAAVAVAPPRSEERRVRKECRSRWSPYH